MQKPKRAPFSSLIGGGGGINLPFTLSKIMYLIPTVWHLATPFIVFSPFLDLTLTGHVTHKYGFLSNRKTKFTVILEVAKF